MGRLENKAFLKYFDENDLAGVSNSALRQLRHAFLAGLEVGRKTPHLCEECGSEEPFCRSCYANTVAETFILEE